MPDQTPAYDMVASRSRSASSGGLQPANELHHQHTIHCAKSVKRRDRADATRPARDPPARNDFSLGTAKHPDCNPAVSSDKNCMQCAGANLHDPIAERSDAQVPSAASHTPAQGGRLELVVLNGCDSYYLGNEILTQGVSHVVCWRTRVKDTAAREFAVAFFKQLREGGSAQRAYGMAKDAVLHMTAPGTLATGVASRVQRYVLRNPRLQVSSAQFTFWPKPVACGIPVLLSQDEGEIA